MKIRKNGRAVRASRRAVKASSDSYWKVWMSYATEDGSPVELQGTAIEEVFDSAMPYDKKYYRGRTYFTEKFFDNEADARAYKAKFDRYIGVNFAEIESSRNVSCSAKRTVRASRASRVMAAKRSIHFTVTVTDTDEIIDVLEDQDEAIEVARKYTQKYGDSATVEKEWIGSDGEVYDSTVCFQTDGDFNSSTRIAKRRAVKASSWGIDDPRSDYLESKNFKKVVFNGSGQYDRGYTKSYMTADHRIGHISVNPHAEYAVDVDIMDANYVDHRIDIPSGIPTNLSPENYENDLASIEDFLYNYDLNEYGYARASTKIAKIKRAVKASVGSKKAIMAGAGSGITLELNDLTFTEIPDGGFYEEFNEYHDFLEPENGYCKGTIDIASIGTYYDGGDPGIGEIPVDIQVVAVYPDNADEAQEVLGYSLKDILDSITDMEKRINIGGGWTRSTFTGEFETDAYSYDYTIKLKVKIADEGLAQWLDEFAHGESEELFYDICINGDYQGNYYESMEDAIETAKEYADDPQYAEDEITVVIEHYNTDYNGEISWYFDDNGDVVWNSNDALYE